MIQNDTGNPLPKTIVKGAKPVQNSSLNDRVIPVAAPKKKSPKPAQYNPLDDLSQFNREDLVKGFVFSLVLDKPKCLQRGRR